MLLRTQSYPYFSSNSAWLQGQIERLEVQTDPDVPPATIIFFPTSFSGDFASLGIVLLVLFGREGVFQSK